MSLPGYNVLFFRNKIFLFKEAPGVWVSLCFELLLIYLCFEYGKLFNVFFVRGFCRVNAMKKIFLRGHYQFSKLVFAT